MHFKINTIKSHRSLRHACSAALVFALAAMTHASLASAQASSKANANITRSKASAPTLLAGPMIGATTMRQVKLWVQATSATRATIEYWDRETPALVRRSKALPLTESSDFAGTFVIGELEPGRTYGYRVLFDGRVQSVPQSLAFQTQALWQWRSDAPNWKMAFNSCVFSNVAKYDRPGRPYGGPPEMLRIYDVMAKQQPDLTLWGGDYLYFREADEDSEFGLRDRWRQARGVPEQQAALRVGAHVAIWDDHEYGPNDSNSSYPLKGEALRLFKQYWPNNTHGLPETPGIFGNYRFNDAEIFMLDNRYHRDSDELKAEDKTKLGAAQLRWLKNALLSSVSPVKIIAAGSQVTNDIARFESWKRFPREREDILKFLVEHRINGVIFLTGDRHFTAVYKTERPGTYPLHELTCSPLLSGTPSNVDIERANPQVIPGTFVAERNFCTLEFSGARAERKITIKSFTTTGEQKFAHELKLSDLQTPRAP
jgi:alkaline phosphatase D